MRIFKYILALFAVCVAVAWIPDIVGQPSRQMEGMRGVDSRLLLEKGERWLTEPDGGDSALVCFSVVASRYDSGQSLEEKEMAVKAARGKWLVYFSYLFDYPKAYESIQEALDICDKENLDKSKVYVSLGSMLHVMADQGGSEELYHQAIETYGRAMSEGMRRENMHAVDMSFINMLIVSLAVDETDSVRRYWDYYRQLPLEENPRRRFVRTLYSSTVGGRGTPVDRVDSILHGVGELPDVSEYTRLHFIGLKGAAELARESGLTGKALPIAMEALDYSTSNGIKDGEIEVLLLLSEIYRDMGEREKSSETFDEYLRKKEGMVGSRLIQRLDELRFLADLRKADQEIASMKAERERHRLIIVFLIIIVVVIGVSVWIIAQKNSKLSVAYRTLYRQFQTSVREDERRARTDVASSPEDEGSGGSIENDDRPECVDSATGDARKEETRKYEGSGLGDDKRERILSRLGELVLDADVICSSECNVAMMASLAGCHPKYLSQVINEEYGCNFNMFINEYRIREAARRLRAGGEWDRLTMEGIANSVGFKSRSTFVSMFKQFTGMTPSVYKRIGKEEDKS